MTSSTDLEGQAARLPAAWSAYAPLVPPLLLMGCFFITPISFLLIISFRVSSPTDLFGNEWTILQYYSVLSDPFYLSIIIRTLTTSVSVALAALVIGYPTAMYLARVAPRRRALYVMLLLTPLMVSNIVRAYGWIVLLARNGTINAGLINAGLIDSPMPMLYSQGAVVSGLLTVFLPFMVLMLLNTLTVIDTIYSEAAQSLGSGPVSTFLRVTLPLSMPGIVAGTLLVFCLSLSAYVTILLLGGPRYKLLVSLVYDSVVAFNWPRAAALSFILLLLAVVAVALLITILRPQRVQGRS